VNEGDPSCVSQVKVRTQVAVFPHKSVAVNVKVCVCTQPSEDIAPGRQVGVTDPEILSHAEI